MKIDWWLVGAVLPVTVAGLVTMYSFTGENSYASNQVIWIILGFGVLFLLSSIDFRFLRSTWISVSLFGLSVALLVSLFFIGKTSHGAENWISFGLFSFQPSDFAKLVLIIVLAKYFSRRHIEIANIKHILISGLYAFIIFALVIGLPDMGSAAIVFLMWFFMILVSGVSKKHLFIMLGVGLLSAVLLWNYVLHDYQKNRVLNFIDPYADIHSTGYNAYQSAIAVGSGGVMGKGFGYGTQSRLKFLPEYQTDFIFAAYAEEWGFIGVIILFGLYGIIVYRILSIAIRGDTNFEILFGLGSAIYFIVHIIINIGMNIQLLPVTGTPLPFMSYGGTHMISEFAILGILSAMNRYGRSAHKGDIKKDFILT